MLIKIGEVDEEVQISSYKINVMHIWASLMAQWYRIWLPTQEMQLQSLGREDALEEGMATHSSILENPMDRGA